MMLRKWLVYAAMVMDMALTAKHGAAKFYSAPEKPLVSNE
jgi:hypothetical protein